MNEDSATLIKENLNIADLVGRYVQLKKRGNKMIACCPFHSEKTPSFNIDPQKGLYHCFGCGKGGDLIRFAMDIENLPFVEALDFLAEIAGIELPKQRGTGPGRDTIEAIRAVNLEAMDFYHRQLRRHKHAMEYLLERGLRESTIDLFKLGFAPNQWEALKDHFGDRFDPAMLRQSGLFREGRNGTHFDLFRDRIIFPILDHYGNVIAFGGRLIEGDGPKYINSPESPIYKKGKHLYNLNFAKAFLKKQKSVVVVEGYMDVIQVYQAGVGAVIAGLGTAFTPEQAKLLGRYAEKVILNFDGDPAGFKAARASIETFLERDMEIGVVSLPERQDPDDFVRQHGVATYREALETASGFYDFLLQYLGGNIENDPRQRSVAAQEISGSLSKITDPVVRNFYSERLSQDLAISTAVVEEIMLQKNEPVKAPARKDAPVTRVVSERRINFSAIEREFLFHVMRQNDFIQCLKEEHREALPKVLHSIFQDRPWILDFIYFGQPDSSFDERLQVVPEAFRAQLRGIYFEEAFEDFLEEDRQRLEALFPDLLGQMLLKVYEINKQRIRTMAPHEEDNKRILRKKNHALMNQYHILKNQNG